jgi:hypothetical protein
LAGRFLTDAARVQAGVTLMRDERQRVRALERQRDLEEEAHEHMMRTLRRDQPGYDRRGRFIRTRVGGRGGYG